MYNGRRRYRIIYCITKFIVEGEKEMMTMLVGVVAGVLLIGFTTITVTIGVINFLNKSHDD